MVFEPIFAHKNKDFMLGIYLIVLLFMLISWMVSSRLKSKFNEYSQIPFRGDMTGAEVAAKMLKGNGIYDVNIISVDGQLTDNYNPVEKTVNLSPEVYHGRSVMSAAIAAHECGDAYNMPTLTVGWVCAVRLHRLLALLPNGCNGYFWPAYLPLPYFHTCLCSV